MRGASCFFGAVGFNSVVGCPRSETWQVPCARPPAPTRAPVEYDGFCWVRCAWRWHPAVTRERRAWWWALSGMRMLHSAHCTKLSLSRTALWPAVRGSLPGPWLCAHAHVFPFLRIFASWLVVGRQGCSVGGWASLSSCLFGVPPPTSSLFTQPQSRYVVRSRPTRTCAHSLRRPASNRPLAHAQTYLQALAV